jgi:hypothetical protein
MPQSFNLFVHMPMILAKCTGSPFGAVFLSYLDRQAYRLCDPVMEGLDPAKDLWTVVAMIAEHPNLCIRDFLRWKVAARCGMTPPRQLRRLDKRPRSNWRTPVRQFPIVVT